MAMQEFLASFAVDIDESGVNRLQSILKDNKSLADALASAFQAAKTALQEYAAEAANTDLPFADLFSRQGDAATDALSNAVSSFTGEVILPVSLDLTKANQALRAFKNSDATKLRLTGDASAVVAAANTALASIKAAYSGTTLSLSAKIEAPAGPSAGTGTAATTGTGNAGSAAQATPSGTATTGTTNPAIPSGSATAGSGLLRSSGGRFTRSTTTEVAEDGQTEYIIPIQKESIAVPLIRQMLGELSPSAKEFLLKPVGSRALKKAFENLRKPILNLPKEFSESFYSGSAAIGERVKMCREQRSISRQELADLMNVSRQTIFRWEQGERLPDIMTLLTLARILGITVTDLLEKEK